MKELIQKYDLMQSIVSLLDLLKELLIGITLYHFLFFLTSKGSVFTKIHRLHEIYCYIGAGFVSDGMEKRRNLRYNKLCIQECFTGQNK